MCYRPPCQHENREKRNPETIKQTCSHFDQIDSYIVITYQYVVLTDTLNNRLEQYTSLLFTKPIVREKNININQDCTLHL